MLKTHKKRMILIILAIGLMFSLSFPFMSTGNDWWYLYLPNPRPYVSPVTNATEGTTITLNVLKLNVPHNSSFFNVIYGIWYFQITLGTQITAKIRSLPSNSSARPNGLVDYTLTHPNGTTRQIKNVSVNWYDWTLSAFIFTDWAGWRNYFEDWQLNQSIKQDKLYNYKVLETEKYFGFYNDAYVETTYRSDYIFYSTFRVMRWFNKSNGALLYDYAFINVTYFNTSRVYIDRFILSELCAPGFTPPINPLTTTAKTTNKFLDLFNGDFQYSPIVYTIVFISLVIKPRRISRK